MEEGVAHEEGASGVHLVEEDSSEEDHEVEDFKEEDLEEEDSAVVAVLVDVKYQKHRYHSYFDRQITPALFFRSKIQSRFLRMLQRRRFRLVPGE